MLSIEEARIGIVGLGYVGLPLAVEFGKIMPTVGFDIKKERVEDASKVLSVGDEIEAKFISLDRKNRSLALSIRALEDDELADALEEYHSQNASSGTTSLGELLKEQLDQDS